MKSPIVTGRTATRLEHMISHLEAVTINANTALYEATNAAHSLAEVLASLQDDFLAEIGRRGLGPIQEDRIMTVALEAILAHSDHANVWTGGDEPDLEGSNDIPTIIETCWSVSHARVEFFKDGKPRGWIEFVIGNGVDVISDHAAGNGRYSPTIGELIEPAMKLAERFSGVDEAQIEAAYDRSDLPDYEDPELRKHDFYETGDADAPRAIQDKNGEVVLRCCRVCGQAEAGLEAACPGGGPRKVAVNPALGMPYGGAESKDENQAFVEKMIADPAANTAKTERRDANAENLRATKH